MTKPKKNTKAGRPTGHARVVMYNVGFGDCFLLSFEYASGPDRHVLIDCGTSTENSQHMLTVAKQIAKDCEGRLDAIVATHRHSDHVSGFGNRAIQKVLEGLNPSLVVQPWTEHPKAEPKATSAPSVFTAASMRFTLQAQEFLQAMRLSERFCRELVDNVEGLLPGLSDRSCKLLASMAALQITNASAVNWLQDIGKRHAYVHAGSESGLEKVLPGIGVRVLGPPTLEQSADIRKQTRSNPDEFWKLQAQLSKVMLSNTLSSPGKTVLRNAKTTAIAEAPPHARWWIRHVDRAQGHNMQAIVTALDRAMNNTSVILLFKVGSKRLLFSGDAQWENWEYALGQKQNQKELAKTNLYKVGHHASRNATPREGLWELFAYRGKGKNRLVTLLSTRPGKHNDVPCKSLVAQLAAQSKLKSTDDTKELSVTCSV